MTKQDLEHYLNSKNLKVIWDKSDKTFRRQDNIFIECLSCGASKTLKVCAFNSAICQCYHKNLMASKPVKPKPVKPKSIWRDRDYFLQYFNSIDDNFTIDLTLTQITPSPKDILHFVCTKCHSYYIRQAYGIRHFPLQPCSYCELLNRIETGLANHPNKDKYKIVSVKDYKNITFKCIKCGKHTVTSYRRFFIEKDGCICNKKSKGEVQIAEILKLLKLDFIEQYNSRQIDNTTKYRFDFFVESHRLFIEYNGEQHYREVNWGNKRTNPKEIYNDTVRRDKSKKELCQKYNYKLLVIPYTLYDNIEEIVRLITEYIN